MQKKFERNNKIEQTFIHETEQSFVVFADTNILHGGIVETIPLPLETFLQRNTKLISEIFNTPYNLSFDCLEISFFLYLHSSIYQRSFVPQSLSLSFVSLFSLLFLSLSSSIFAPIFLFRYIFAPLSILAPLSLSTFAPIDIS